MRLVIRASVPSSSIRRPTRIPAWHCAMRCRRWRFRSSRCIFPTCMPGSRSGITRIFQTWPSALSAGWVMRATCWPSNTCLTSLILNSPASAGFLHPTGATQRGVSMDLRTLTKLIDLVQESGISELEVTEGEEKVRIAKHYGAAAVAAPQQYYAAPAPMAAPGAPAVSSVNLDDEDELPEGHVVKSPMVGTFYRSPSPGADAFVQVGP